MKTKKVKKPKTNRKVDGAIGVRRAVAAKFSAFCKTRGWQVATMAEQALAGWMEKTRREETINEKAERAIAGLGIPVRAGGK